MRADPERNEIDAAAVSAVVVEISKSAKRRGKHQKQKNMPSQPYIPAADADFNNWLLNFSNELTLAPVTYGLLAGDAVIVAGVTTTWTAAYEAATNPATRTGPTIAAKDAARASAEATVRPFAQRIRVNPAVTNEARATIGVTIAAFPPTPIPPPLTNPELSLVRMTPLTHVFSYADATTPTSKAKPYGVKFCQVFVTVGIAPAVDPTVARFIGGFTKSPLQVTFDAADRGKVATYFPRWQNGSGPGGIGATGPWGTPQSFIIP